MKRYIIIAGVSGLVCSVISILITLYTKGIHIHNTYNQQQYQNQQQAQIVIDLYARRGYLEWRYTSLEAMKKMNLKPKCDSAECLRTEYLNTIPQVQAITAKREGNGYAVPVITENPQNTIRNGR